MILHKTTSKSKRSLYAAQKLFNNNRIKHEYTASDPSSRTAATIGNTHQQSMGLMQQFVPMEDDFNHIWSVHDITAPQLETENAMVVETKHTTPKPRVIDFDRYVSFSQDNQTKTLYLGPSALPDLTVDEAQTLAAYIKSNQVPRVW